MMTISRRPKILLALPFACLGALAPFVISGVMPQPVAGARLLSPVRQLFVVDAQNKKVGAVYGFEGLSLATVALNVRDQTVVLRVLYERFEGSLGGLVFQWPNCTGPRACWFAGTRQDLCRGMLPGHSSNGSQHGRRAQ